MAAQHPLHDIGPVHRNEDPWGIGDDLDEAAERDQGVTVGAAPDHFQPPAVHDPRSLEPQAARKAADREAAIEARRRFWERGTATPAAPSFNPLPHARD